MGAPDRASEDSPVDRLYGQRERAKREGGAGLSRDPLCEAQEVFAHRGFVGSQESTQSLEQPRVARSLAQPIAHASQFVVFSPKFMDGPITKVEQVRSVGGLVAQLIEGLQGFGRISRVEGD